MARCRDPFAAGVPVLILITPVDTQVPNRLALADCILDAPVACMMPLVGLAILRRTRLCACRPERPKWPKWAESHGILHRHQLANLFRLDSRTVSAANAADVHHPPRKSLMMASTQPHALRAGTGVAWP